MKDFDDLWRLSQSKSKISWQKVASLLKGRESNPFLNANWINPEMERAWERHRKKYKDLPTSLMQAIEEINQWLKETKK